MRILNKTRKQLIKEEIKYLKAINNANDLEMIKEIVFIRLAWLEMKMQNEERSNNLKMKGGKTQ